MKPIILILIAMVVTVTVWIVAKQMRKPGPMNTANLPTESQFPPRPEWRPDIPVDHGQIIQTFRSYSNDEMAFVLFEHGTCVPVEATSAQPEQDAITILNELFQQHPDFDPKAWDDGHWLVSFSGKAYAICFSDEVEDNWDKIDQNHLNLLIIGYSRRRRPPT